MSRPFLKPSSLPHVLVEAESTSIPMRRQPTVQKVCAVAGYLIARPNYMMQALITQTVGDW